MAKTHSPRYRVPMWLPYLQSIEKQRGGIWEFVYNGGVETTALDDVSSIMLYGETNAALNSKMLDEIARRGIPIIIHRRNMSQPIYIFGGARPDPDDTLSYQLIKRTHSLVTTHISRQVLAAKFRSMQWLVPPVDLPRNTTVEKLRYIEAAHAKKYWKKYMTKLGQPHWTRRSSGSVSKNPAATALDANSKFVTGILLRWLSYHHLSPYHGFLHTPTDYPSLVYDLFEPYRGLIERELLVGWINNGTDPEDMLSHGIEITKVWLGQKTYVPLTRQIVTNGELFHGAVLSLKYYLLGKQRKFHIPFPGPAKGGRPPKVDFLLYGRHAGKSDFWAQAREVAQNDDESTVI